MGSSKKQKARVFNSMEEIEQRYLPSSYKKNMEEENDEKPGRFGAKLADEILRTIKKKLAS